MSSSTEKFTVIGSTPKGQQRVLHITAVALDDAEGYARHSSAFAAYVVLSGHINPVASDEADIPSVKQVDMTAADFAA